MEIDNPIPDSSDSASANPPLIRPEEFSSWIVFEDEDLLAINKPGGIVCHPSKQGPWSSLVGACREYLDVETIHLVHRIDRETSGLVLMAKNRQSARLTQMAFQNRQVSKTYLAILEGELQERVQVSNHLARDMESPVYIRQTVRKSNSSKKAETEFIPLISSGGYTLAKVIPHTGRKHQIRAHAFWLNHPVVADKIYGADDTLYLEFIEKGWTPRLEDSLPLRHQALHAYALSFNVPNFTKTFTAPLTPTLQAFLRENLQIEDVEEKLKAISNPEAAR